MVSFHVEPTSKCTLECPLCDRTWFYETFKKRNLHEINVDHVVDFIGVDKQVLLSGNNGDPIYHSKFLELCKKLKDNHCKIIIVTNGSAKTKNWWQKLNNILDQNDQITFSIDGLEDTNHLYRKNAKWKSIMMAVNTFEKRRCRMVWKYIIFKHNQHQILKANELCEKLGFDFFRLEKSNRWLGKKDLMPDREYIDNYYQQQEKVMIDPKYKATMQPKCLKNHKPENELYIDSEGNFYPCCYMGTHRYKFKHIFSPKNSSYNIKSDTLDKILDNQNVKKFFESTKDFDSAHECCKIYCGGKK